MLVFNTKDNSWIDKKFVHFLDKKLSNIAVFVILTSGVATFVVVQHERLSVSRKFQYFFEFLLRDVLEAELVSWI